MSGRRRELEYSGCKHSDKIDERKYPHNEHLDSQQALIHSKRKHSIRFVAYEWDSKQLDTRFDLSKNFCVWFLYQTEKNE